MSAEYYHPESGGQAISAEPTPHAALYGVSYIYGSLSENFSNHEELTIDKTKKGQFKHFSVHCI